jgi:hypothetical protein
MTEPRGFTYPLEPLRVRRRWEMEELQARLGRATRTVGEARVALAAQRRRFREQAAVLASATTERLDPVRQRQALAWLVQTRTAIRASEASLAALVAERSKLARACADKQKQLEAIDDHREECARTFQQEESALQARNADDDWLMRASHRGRGADDGAVRS